MEIKINIDNYLSEEEKKEIARDAFSESIRKGLTEKESSKNNYDNYERVISNSVYRYLEQEVDNILDCNTKDMIKSNVLKTIKKTDYSYSLFRKKGIYESEDSPAQIIAKQAVESHREEMTKKIKEKLSKTIDEIDFDTLYEMYTNAFHDFIIERIGNK